MLRCGISVDTFYAKAFHDQQKLAFPLLCDFNKQVIRAGVFNEDMIGPKGIAKRAVSCSTRTAPSGTARSSTRGTSPIRQFIKRSGRSRPGARARLASRVGLDWSKTLVLAVEIRRTLAPSPELSPSQPHLRYTERMSICSYIQE
jgi:hypothetical protein